jgi:folate-binding protein YgfZ
MPSEQSLREYEALTAGAGFVELGPRTQIEVTGHDRATFLHNLCTNDIRKLDAGQGCEAFFTNVQGKVLAHAYVWARRESLVISTVADVGQKLLAHLDRYLIREQVELIDRSQQWAELLLGGAHAIATLARLGVEFEHNVGPPVDITRPTSILLSCRLDELDDVRPKLAGAGATRCGAEALEMARIEAGFPWYGQDISEDNLAPEVGRDKQAINYVKGCYLGQETIARIDALGHVNRLLVGLAFEGSDVPPRGTELFSGGKSVGHVTSAAFSPKLNVPLALAYVRRGHHELGQPISSAKGTGAIVRLPL